MSGANSGTAPTQVRAVRSLEQARRARARLARPGPAGRQLIPPPGELRRLPGRVRPEVTPSPVERAASRHGRFDQPLALSPDPGRLVLGPVERVPGALGELVLVLPPPATVRR